MTLQNGGPISLGNVKAEFGGNASPKLSDYYKNGPFNKNGSSTVPSSGMIALSAFYGASKKTDTVFRSSGDIIAYQGYPGDQIIFPDGGIHQVTNIDPILISGSTTAGIFTIIHATSGPNHSVSLAGQGLTEIISMTDELNVTGFIGYVIVYAAPGGYNFDLYTRPNLKKVPTFLPENITDISNFFISSASLETDITGWNVSKVTNMYGLFSGARSFNQNISGWDVSKVTEMGYMFNDTTVFNQNIVGWNVSKVTNMQGMFNKATAFNQAIGTWNVGNVGNMTEMFRDATSFNQYLGDWCVSKITSEPTDFATNATKLLSTNKPRWGTCVTGQVV